MAAATPTQPPKFTHVMNLRAYMSRNGSAAGCHRGGATRHLAPLTGGFLKGVEGTRAEGLDVELMPGGSDWLMVDDTTSMCHLDVRTHGTNKAGDGFFIYYTGYLGHDKAAAQFTSWDPEAKTTKGGDHHWWTNPNFETSSTFQTISVHLMLRPLSFPHTLPLFIDIPRRKSCALRGL